MYVHQSFPQWHVLVSLSGPLSNHFCSNVNVRASKVTYRSKIYSIRCEFIRFVATLYNIRIENVVSHLVIWNFYMLQIGMIVLVRNG